jgi:hypothetical protein
MAVVDKFQVKFWNGSYYCKVMMPNGQSVELKSGDDLTYTQWQEKIQAAWDDIQNPEPTPEECQCPKCKANFVCENRS